MKTFMIKQDGGVVLLKQFDFEMTEKYVVTIEAKVHTFISSYSALYGFETGGIHIGFEL